MSAVPFVEKAARFGAARLDRRVSPEEAAAEVGYSPFHFQRLFHAIAGEPWGAFHRRLRLEHGARLLLETKEPVFRVALMCGFEAHEPFIRAFRHAYGRPPSNFRNSFAGKPLLPSPNGAHAFDPIAPFTFGPVRCVEAIVPFEIVPFAVTKLVGLRHCGPLQFISATWLQLAGWAKEGGVDLSKRLLVTFSNDLEEEADPEDQIGFVAIDDRGELGLERFEIGGGEYLKATHAGSGHLLADFWFRIYASCVPASGRTLRDAPAFQIYPQGLFVEDPSTFVTDIYIPVESVR